MAKARTMTTARDGRRLRQITARASIRTMAIAIERARLGLVLGGQQL